MRVFLVLLCTALLAACTDEKSWTLKRSAEFLADTGKLRFDRSPDDAPFDEATLARNFELIAFGVEADPLGVGAEARNSPLILRRWEKGIVYSLVGSAADDAEVRSGVARTANRLQQLSGRPVSIRKPKGARGADDPTANVMVLLGDAGFFNALTSTAARDRLVSARRTKAAKQLTRTSLDFVDDWHGSNSPCAATIYWPDNPDKPSFGHISVAVVAIRTDLGKSLLQVCLEEELTQIMGLANDNTDVRPSIFNDDQEFGLLTDHDALLLRALYDDRLRPGMSVDTAMPVVREIMTEFFRQGPAPQPKTPEKPATGGNTPESSSALSG